MDVIVYHNPRCSKSRQTVALLEDRGVDFKIVEYLNETPGIAEIENILAKLAKRPRDIMRKNEPVYKDMGLAGEHLSDDDLIAAMVAHPILIERPIVVAGARAALGRPPESVLDIL